MGDIQTVGDETAKLIPILINELVEGSLERKTFHMTSDMRKRRGLFLATLVLIFLLLLVACNGNVNTSHIPETNELQSQNDKNRETSSIDHLHKQDDPSEQHDQELSHAPPETAREPATLTLAAVGDIMMHSPQFPAYYDSRTGLYDFTSYFKSVKPYIDSADLAWANLETPLLGGEKEYTGYPMFNAPPELADALQWSGFDIVTTANNHALDRRGKGAMKTLDVLKSRGFVTRGTYESQWAASQTTIVEKNGIKLGILAYTYGTNGIPLPQAQPYLVDLIQEEKILQDIKRTREAGADAVAIALHFGNEYEHVPNEAQQRLARSLAAGGADLILGSHPHVLQPYERIQVQEPDGSTREAVIMYSLGNFISNQRGEQKDVGCIFHVTFQKDLQGHTAIIDTSALPTWVDRSGKSGAYHYEVIPLAAELMKQDTARWTAAQFKQMTNMLHTADQLIYSMTAIPVIQSKP